MNIMPLSKEGIPNPLITNPILFMKHAHRVSVIALCGILTTMGTPILAQDDKPLVLQKGDEVVVIPAGDWVVAVDATGNKVLGTGRYQGTVYGTLVLRESLAGASFKGWWRPLKSLRYLGTSLSGRDTTCVEHRVPIGEIAALYHGEAMRHLYYIRRAAVTSLRAGAVLGGAYVMMIPAYGVLSVLMGNFSNKDKSDDLQFLLAVAYAIPWFYGYGVFASCYISLFTILPIEVATGLVKHGLAKQYLIDPGQWEIWE